MESYIEEKVREIIAKELDVKEEKVVPDARLAEDLRASSLELCEIGRELEDMLSSEISNKELFGLKTVQDVFNCVDQHRGINLVKLLVAKLLV